jgi:hypothetical protein
MADNEKMTAARHVREATANRFALHEVKNLSPRISAGSSPGTERRAESEDIAAFLVDMIECLQELAHQRGFKSLSYMLDVARSEAENIHNTAPAERESSIGSD